MQLEFYTVHPVHRSPVASQVALHSAFVVSGVTKLSCHSLASVANVGQFRDVCMKG